MPNKVFVWLFLLLVAVLSEAAESPALRATDSLKSRVLIVHDANATDAFRPLAEHVRSMVEQGITNVTGTVSVPSAWRSLVSTQDVVGIKVFSAPGPNSGTRPAVVEAIVDGLLATGLPAKNIVIWDRVETDLRLAGYTELAGAKGIRCGSSTQAGYDPEVFYDNSLLGTLVWGDLEFGKKERVTGRRSYVSKLVTREVTKIINVTPLLNHNMAGVCGNLFSLALGSVDNASRFEQEPERLAIAVPEIYNLTNLNDRVVMNITDALICQYEGGERGLLHYSTALNELRFSRDPVALDVLSIAELERQRAAAKAPSLKPNWDLYQNAELLQLGTGTTNRVVVKRVEIK